MSKQLDAELIRDLLEALKVAHAAISTLDEDELGTGFEGEAEWSIRDEVLAKLAAAIVKAEGRAAGPSRQG